MESNLESKQINERMFFMFKTKEEFNLEGKKVHELMLKYEQPEL